MPIPRPLLKLVRAFALLALAALLIFAAGAQPLHPFSKYDQPARAILAKMTLDEKIGQMLQPDQQFLKSVDDIEKYHLGCTRDTAASIFIEIDLVLKNNQRAAANGRIPYTHTFS